MLQDGATIITEQPTTPSPRSNQSGSVTFNPWSRDAENARSEARQNREEEMMKRNASYHEHRARRKSQISERPEDGADDRRCCERSGAIPRPPACLDCCPPCLKGTTHWCLLFWFNKETSIFWLKILMFEMIEWGLLVTNVYVDPPGGIRSAWAMGLCGVALFIDLLSLPLLYTVWARPDAPQSHGLKFQIFALEHITDVLGTIALANLHVEGHEDGSSACMRADWKFQLNLVFIVFRLYILCTRTALEELVESCTSLKKTQCALKLVSAIGLIGTGALTTAVLLGIDFNTCEKSQKSLFGIGHTELFPDRSDTYQLLYAYAVTFAFIFLFICVLVLGRMWIEGWGPEYAMGGRTWGELNPWHDAHKEARGRVRLPRKSVLSRSSHYLVKSLFGKSAEDKIYDPEMGNASDTAANAAPEGADGRPATHLNPIIPCDSSSVE